MFCRKNLHIVTQAHVTEILSRTDGKYMPQITGVKFVKNGNIYQVKSRKEVILSAGAIGTPQVLMLSGIGPKDHLDENKVFVKARYKRRMFFVSQTDFCFTQKGEPFSKI